MGMMRIITAFLFAIGLFAATAHAQEVRVVNGDKYIVHTVAAGQTLYGISKHYAVDLPDLTKANPGATTGLSVGQVLLVPMAGRSRKEIKSAPELSHGELLHTVSKKETLYGISKQYGVSQEALTTANSELSFGLRPGMQLRIPVSVSTAAPPAAIEPATADNAQFHQVLSGETLYSLGKLFGVSPEEVKAANNGLPEGLKAGLYIRVPTATIVETDTVVKPDVVIAPPRGTPRKIAVLLPFTATARDTSEGAPSGDQSQVTYAALEFRAGMAMALDSLQAKGLNAEVKVYDSGTRASQWGALYQSEELRGMDLYIGPFHRAALESLVRVAGDAPIVCPVPQSNKVLLGNPTISKALGSRADQVKQLARYAVQHRKGAKVLMLRPTIPKERDLQALMLRELRGAVAPDAPPSDSVVAVDCGRRDVTGLMAKLDPVKTNFVVVPSEDIEFVTAAITAMAGMAGKYKLSVYGMDSWKSIPTLDIASLMKLDTHLPASTAIDIEDPRVAAFIGAYRDLYHNEPGEYAFLGYDVTLFYLTALMQFGKGFPAHFNEVKARPLHMTFDFSGLGPENGRCNTGAVVLHYGADGIKPVRWSAF
jgi:LysM repeat protein